MNSRNPHVFMKTKAEISKPTQWKLDSMLMLIQITKRQLNTFNVKQVSEEEFLVEF